MAEQGVSAVGVGVLAAGAVLVWSGIRGASVVATLQEIIRGQRPSGALANPVEGGGGARSGPINSEITGKGASSSVLQMAVEVAKSPAGRRNYCLGGGHQGSPCQAKCFDCSGYVSCVLGKLGKMTGSKVTGEFMVWTGAKTIPYEQRQPGDLYCSPGHIGIIADNKQMWNAACTKCGAVKLSSYVGRKNYIVRRVK